MQTSFADALRAELIELIRAELDSRAIGSNTTSVDVLVDERELAIRLRIPVRTLQHWRLLGRGGPPYRKVGRAVRYSLVEVDAWEKKRQA